VYRDVQQTKRKTAPDFKRLTQAQFVQRQQGVLMRPCCAASRSCAFGEGLAALERLGCGAKPVGRRRLSYHQWF
jgi:hypothetical protein